jgi:hypothetical protein
MHISLDIPQWLVGAGVTAVILISVFFYWLNKNLG